MEYENIYIYSFIFAKKRSFRGLGGIIRGLDSVTAPKSVRGNWPLWCPVVSRGPQVASR